MYMSFMQDGFSQPIPGFTVRSSISAEFVTSTLLHAMRVCRRMNPELQWVGVIHRSDAGSQLRAR